MRKVTGIIAVLLVVLVISGCAGGKKRRTSEGAGPEETSYENVLQRVAENNIVTGGFIIQKGSIELKGTPVEGEFGFNAKLNSLGDIVPSVRGPLGIELSRARGLRVYRLRPRWYVGGDQRLQEAHPRAYLRILAPQHDLDGTAQ